MSLVYSTNGSFFMPRMSISVRRFGNTVAESYLLLTLKLCITEGVQDLTTKRRRIERIATASLPFTRSTTLDGNVCSGCTYGSKETCRPVYKLRHNFYLASENTSFRRQVRTSKQDTYQYIPFGQPVIVNQSENRNRCAETARFWHWNICT